VIFFDKDITNEPSYKIAQLGISRTFQLIKPFSRMTVYETLLVPYFSRGVLDINKEERLLKSWIAWALKKNE
jgi:branched-chain amino acid transport system ATP-binding protein